MEPNFEVLSMLSTAPDTQASPKLKEMIGALAGKTAEEVKVGLHEALDFSARYAWASSFVMTVMDGEWKRLGGKITDPAPWRDKETD